jgi:hypothetical protein
MTTIDGLGPMAPARRPRRAAAAAGDFQLATAPAGEGAPAAPAAAIGLDALLALQEGAADNSRDRRARRHAQEMLAALRDLQRARLGAWGQDNLAALSGLARLAGAVPAADDPRLVSIVRAIAVRAAVELARRQQG